MCETRVQHTVQSHPIALPFDRLKGCTSDRHTEQRDTGDLSDAISLPPPTNQPSHMTSVRSTLPGCAAIHWNYIYILSRVHRTQRKHYLQDLSVHALAHRVPTCLVSCRVLSCVLGLPKSKPHNSRKTKPQDTCLVNQPGTTTREGQTDIQTETSVRAIQ